MLTTWGDRFLAIACIVLFIAGSLLAINLLEQWIRLRRRRRRR